jgi:NitT/TauT family transport system substrate-binding protein
MTLSRLPALLLAALLGVQGRPAPAAEGITLMVGGIDKIIYLPVKLAEQLGYFRSEGVDVEVHSQFSGSQGVDELLVGSAQGAVGFYDHVIMLQAMGKSVVSLIQFAQAPGEVELASTQADRPLMTMADLKGARLGVTSLGSSTQFLSRYLVQAAGLKPSQVTYVTVGTGDAFIQAMVRGAIQAGMTTEPTASRLLEAGQARVLADLRTPEETARALDGPYPAACLYMETAWVERHKPEVQKLVNALVKALRFIQTHTASEIADQLPSSFYTCDRATYVKALTNTKPIFIPDGRMPAKGPANVLRLLNRTEKSLQGRTIDLPSTYTLEFVNAARESRP